MYQFLRQTQEVIGISAEYDNDPLREEFNKWCAGDIVMGRNPTLFHLLMKRFKEMKVTVDLDKVEKEFRYAKEFMGLSKDKATVVREEFRTQKADRRRMRGRCYVTQMIYRCLGIYRWISFGKPKNNGSRDGGLLELILVSAGSSQKECWSYE